AARNSKRTKEKLREESQVETEEDNYRRKLGPRFGVHAPGHLGPIVMHAAEISHDGSTHHNVMEMRDHEVSVSNMDVDTQCGHKQTGKSADSEQADEAEGI